MPTGITNLCATNPSGMNRFYIANTSQIATFPAAAIATHTLTSSPTMVGTFKYMKSLFLPEESEGFARLLGDVGFQYIEREFKLFVPGLDAANIGTIQASIGGEYSLLFTTTDAKSFLVGEPSAPLRLIGAEQTYGKANSADKRGVLLTYKGNGPVFPYVVGFTITTTLVNTL